MYELKLTKEQEVLLKLTARSLVEDKSALALTEEEVKAVDWTEIVKEASMQAVPLAAFNEASEYKAWIPEEIYARWRNSATSVFASNFRVLQAQVEMSELMDKGNYPYIVLKGTAAGAYYPNAEMRALGDVDFLIDPTQQAELEEKIEELSNGKFKRL